MSINCSLRFITSCLRLYRNKSINNPKRAQLLSNRIRVTIPSMSSFQFSSVNDLRVEHNPKKHQFFVRLGSDKAVLDYSDVDSGVVDLFHTEVPKALEGKGIAKILAKEAFDYVVKNDMKMIVSCSYLQKYLKDNQKPEYLEHLFQTKD